MLRHIGFLALLILPYLDVYHSQLTDGSGEETGMPSFMCPLPEAVDAVVAALGSPPPPQCSPQLGCPAAGTEERLCCETPSDGIAYCLSREDMEGRSEQGISPPVQPDVNVSQPETPFEPRQGDGLLFKLSNDLVKRRYLLPPDWRSVTFVDRKLALNPGRVISFLFFFEDTRRHLNGMFPGMRLQIWTPITSGEWAARMQYRLKCEKVVTRDDVTNVVTSSALPAMLDEQNQVAPDGLLVSLDVSDVECMRVTREDHVGFCSQDLVLPVPYDFGTDGQVDWVFNDAQPGGGAVQFPRLNDVVQFRTLEVQPIPATFSVGVDVIEPLEP